MEVYSTLGLSHIEGIELLNSRFNLAVTTLKKKPYDILDHRTEFDIHCQEFHRQVKEIDVSEK